MIVDETMEVVSGYQTKRVLYDTDDGDDKSGRILHKRGRILNLKSARSPTRATHGGWRRSWCDDYPSHWLIILFNNIKRNNMYERIQSSFLDALAKGLSSQVSSE